jgi:microcin C transport system permease protein
MLSYIIRRLLLIVPTLFLIMVINFVIVQGAPGGPVEQAIARIKGTAVEATARIGGTALTEVSGVAREAVTAAGEVVGKYRGARGLDPELIAELERMYGFDKPAHERFIQMMRNYHSSR